VLTNEDAGSNSAALTISLYLTLDRRTDIGLSLGTANFLRYSRELYDRGNPSSLPSAPARRSKPATIARVLTPHAPPAWTQNPA
jgi:hypothetical protein